MNVEVMNTLMLIMGKAQSEEDTLSKLKASIDEYEMTKSEKAKNEFVFNLMMASSKFLTEGKDTLEILEELDKRKRGNDLLMTDKY